MSLVTSIHAHRKTIIGASLALILMGVYFALQKPAQAVVPFEKGGIPIPFLETSKDGQSGLKGAVTFYDKRNNIDVYEVTFTAGETSEALSENLIYLVHIPNDSAITEKDFDSVMRQTNEGRAVNYYGYQYTDALATVERQNINNADFKLRFPGQFFASAKARAEDATHGNGIVNFERDRGITFRNTNGSLPKSTLQKNALYVLISNEAGANSTKIYPKGAPALCGDGVREGTEVCDDGDQNNTNACKNDCTANTGNDPVCGNGVKEGTEQCDDGNTNNTDSCTNSCTVNTPPPVCGNGTREGTEQCDDGNTNNTDACKNDCTSNTGNDPVCGNGVKEGTEQCDDGDQNNNNLCRTDCTNGLPVPFTTEPTTTPPTTTPPTVTPPTTTPPTTVAPTTVNPPSEDLVFTALEVPSVKGVVFPQVSNQPIETFSRFSLQGNGTLKKLEFTAVQGSIPMAYDYRLWKDTNGDGTVDQEMSIRAVSEENATLVFNLTNEIIATSTPMIFELRALPQATGLLQIFIGGYPNSIVGDTCSHSPCTISIGREHQPTVFAFSAHGSAPSPYALTVEGVDAPAAGILKANEKKSIMAFRVTPHIYDDSSAFGLTSLKVKVVTGVASNAQYELWSDSNGDGVINGIPRDESYDSVCRKGVVNATTRVVTFENPIDPTDPTATSKTMLPCTFLAVDGQSKYFEIHAIHDPVPATEFKMTFAIDQANYIEAIKDDLNDGTKTVVITNIRTNGICNGECSIDVTEKPTTLFTVDTTNPVPLCGNKYKEGSEQCDNGGEEGCYTNCQIDAGYECTGTHPSICTFIDHALCGNGNIDYNDDEECDDKNKTSGDGCSSACTIEEHYSCDGQEILGDRSSCFRCGDAHFEERVEDCDDGNTVGGDGCSADCGSTEDGYICETDTTGKSICTTENGGNGGNTAACGNGTKEGSEACDAGAQNGVVCTAQAGQTCTYCSATCTSVTVQGSGGGASLCGNGVINAGETCDQGGGNVTNGDGCSATCTTEANFRCTGTPTTCISYLNFVKNLADTNKDGTVDENESFSFVLTIGILFSQDNPVIDIKYDINGDGAGTMADISLIAPLMNSL